MVHFRWNYKISDSSQHPRVLFLHGFMGSLQDWDSVINRLQNNYYCLCIDLPGHGGTPNPEKKYSFNDVGTDLVDFLKEINFSPFSIIGYSLGGRLALYLSIRFPDLMKKVILESASPGLKTSRERIIRESQDDALAAKLVNSDFSQLLQEWYDQPIFNSLRQHQDFKKLLKERNMNNPEDLAVSLTALSTSRQPSLWDLLSGNKIPILLMVGELDPKFRGIARQMSRQCPSCRTKIIKNAGHNIHFENPDEFVNRCIEFLSDR
jgi:2-succinyl-6-hydroxy-2,4-cyclohexadiene-1-carboxylate synthase